MTGSVQARLRRLPRIRRARGYRLYTVDGRRILDLWQAGGRAILGHRGEVVSVVKRVLDRGVLAAMPAVQERRLEQALRRLLGDDASLRVAVYASRRRAIEAVASSIGLPASCTPADPARPTNDGACRLEYWRPFLPDAPRTLPWPPPTVLLPILPDGGLFEAQTVVYSSDLGVTLLSDLVPEPALAALTAAAWGLVSSSHRPVLRLPGFECAGPYLALEAVEDYDSVFDCFLRSGVLISPDPEVPSIVPGEMSDGERACLETTARAAVGQSAGRGGTGGN